MQINGNPSLFKATRRTMVAEMTLMIVIVISFSWSAYALYKLFAGGSESLFGYTFASSRQDQAERAQDQSRLNSSQGFPAQPAINQHQMRDSLFDQRDHLDQIDQRDLEGQLANYKNQILNELMARQQRLLGNGRGNGHELLSLLVPSHTNHGEDRLDIDRRPFNVNELQRWKGGYKLPTSLDYLFENNRRPLAQSVGSYSENLEQPDRMPLSSINSHAAVASVKSNVKQPRQHAPLMLLTDAPSLMQLSPSALPAANVEYRHQAITTTPEPNLDSSDPNSVAIEDQIVSTTTTTLPPSLLIDGVETTTIESPSQADESENATDETTPAPNEDQDSENNDDQQLVDGSDKSADADRDDKANDESVERMRNASRSIDEDVDRMTQPSLGMTSREDKPASDYRGTVLFDDGPSARPTSIKDILTGKSLRTSEKRAESPGSSGLATSINTRNPEDDTMWPAGDLLVADNQHKMPVSATSKNSNSEPNRLDTLLNPLGAAVNVDVHRASSLDRKTTKSPTMPFRVSVKRPPGDFEETRALMKRSKRSTPLNQRNLHDGLKVGRVGKQRRSDDDNDEEDDEGRTENNDDKAEDQSVDPEDLKPREGGGGPTLQELLAHKKLLDALQQSQLPPPVVMKQPSSGNGTLPQHALTIKPDHSDHQPAGTQYSVDHGLLLYPASDEEHGHKSSAHKSGKSSKKKGKKKMTVAMKKGGHKHKKHKKEEKKYVKEKKFKGAKKGKKMSKGKGGKGGKKGKKFYKDKGFKKKGFKNIYVKNEFGQKKSYFDEFRDKDFKKKWKNFDDKYNYAQMKKWQAKDVKGAKKMKDQGEHHKKYDKGKWKKNYKKHMESEMAKKKKKQSDDF